MAVRIITDSASDISQETAKEWGITVIPLKVRFGEEEFLDGKTLSCEQFYEKLVETDEIPKTSQINPYEYSELFEEVKKAGDTAVCITLSAKVSGCYQSACIAAEDYEGIVRVVDSAQFCISEGMLVELAKRYRDQGMNADEIADRIEKEKADVHVISVFDTLEYLKKGGRISAAAAMAGGILSIKPVITIENGEVAVIGKARGSKNGNNLLMDFMRSHGGIDFSRPYCIGYTGLSDALLKKYAEDSASVYREHAEKLHVFRVGATIGTYAGPGAIAAAFFEL